MKPIPFFLIVLIKLFDPFDLNAFQTVNSDSIANDFYEFPSRNINESVKNQPGVLNIGINETTIRGLILPGFNQIGIQYYINGINVTDPLFGGIAILPIQIATSEFKTSANSPTSFMDVDTYLLHGSDKLKFGFETTSNLYPSFKNNRELNELSAFVSGGLNAKTNYPIYFYVAAKRTYSEQVWKNNVPVNEYIDGIEIKNIPFTYSTYNKQTEKYEENQEIKDIISPAYSNGAERTQYELNSSIQFKLSGKISFGFTALLNTFKGREAVKKYDLFNFGKRPAYEGKIQVYGGKFDFILSEYLTLKVSGSYSNNFYSSYDPDYTNQVMKYGDPAFNSFYLFNSSSKVIPEYLNYTYAGFNFSYPGSIISDYTKTNQKQWSISSGLEYVFSSDYQIEALFHYTAYQLRNIKYNPSTLFSLKKIYESIGNLTPEESLSAISQELKVNNYGFDLYGNEIDNGRYSLKEPNQTQIRLFNKYQFSPLTIEGGLTFENINLDGITFNEPIKINNKNEFWRVHYIDDSSLNKTSPVSYLLPNLKLSFYVNKNLSLVTKYEHRAIIPSLNSFYIGDALLSRKLLSYNAPVYYEDDILIPFNIKPILVKSIEYGAIYSIQNIMTLTGKLYSMEILNAPIYSDFNFIFQMNNFYPGHIFNAVNYGLQNIQHIYSKGFEFSLLTENINYNKFGFNFTYSRNNYVYKPKVLYIGNIRINFSGNYPGSLESDSYFSFKLGHQIRIPGTEFGINWIKEVGINSVLSLGSGNYFTRVNGYEYLHRRPYETINESQIPINKQINFIFDALLNINGTDFQIFCMIENVLNNKSIYNVFPQTGNSENDGYLNSYEGEQLTNSNYKYFSELYNAFNNQNNPDFFNSPRTVTFGVKVDF